MPSTTNRKLSIPVTGTEVGVWGSNDLNPNFAALDGILGSVTALNLTGVAITTLNDAQQQVAILRFTGALSAHSQVIVSQPGFWIIDNQTTSPSGDWIAYITGAGGGQISTPRGSRYQVFYDGTTVGFVNMPPTGTLMKLVASGVPAWLGASSPQPYLLCDGSLQLIATYPALSEILIPSFGTSGSSFFLPDLRGRAQFDLDSGTGRITNSTFTPNGNTIGAIGGTQYNIIGASNIPSLPFSGTAVVLGSNQLFVAYSTNQGATGTQFLASGGQLAGGTQATINYTPSGSVNAGSPNNPITNIPPAIVSGLTFIKT